MPQARFEAREDHVSPDSGAGHATHLLEVRAFVVSKMVRMIPVAAQSGLDYQRLGQVGELSPEVKVARQAKGAKFLEINGAHGPR